MQNLVRLLPDSIANQIAAGEVVQRPASVVKELIENAVDAGASQIELYIKDAGKTLIQVTDNGCGMSVQDARMCFERHATSKIKNESDLFNIRSLGFRGEALASIASVAHVILKSRLHEEELGTELHIAGGTFKKQEPCVCPPGSSFLVKNLFFNVPARRNFLKSNPVETRHILNEFIRVALPNPDISMQLTHNSTEVFNLRGNTLKNRIIDLFGKNLKKDLIAIEEVTSYVKISGYTGTPKIYRKHRGDQFFFVNRRFIKSGYLHHAVMQAFEEVIPKSTYPFYCIFLEIDPVHVDINIHPTKTEVKFDDERTIYALLQSAIKRALGSLHNAPTLPFDSEKKDLTDDSLKKIIYGTKNRKVNPEIIKNFANTQPKTPKTAKPKDWDELYKPFNISSLNPTEPSQEEKNPQTLFPSSQLNPSSEEETTVFPFVQQFGKSYLLTSYQENLIIVHQQLAHRRVLYERFLKEEGSQMLSSQRLLFPPTLEFTPVDFGIAQEVMKEMGKLGFEVQEFGKRTIIIYAAPPEIPPAQIREVFDQIISDIKQGTGQRTRQQVQDKIARNIAIRSAIPANKELSQEEMNNLLKELFNCEVPTFSPLGKPVYREIRIEELEKYFG